ncbi:hypothetical protein D0T84_18790 [Dysgonomonas sp. 521]|uniref:hypothetical protein n=1 Tax=Dysgonomonas sp. 521 TaxID=2302932 RepID=UPI0013D082D8|nr:hypothetical protein [Dysgonomonas sp. 521]NDV96938.1 hypothetical protein [Dysgonomonas sp. 521]
MDIKKEKKPITIYHVHFFGVDDITQSDYYFGSISAIFEHFEKSEIGIQASSLYNYNFDEVTNPIYENKKCRIRKSILITKSKSK